ncbi:hypothetical protein PAXINDRAFT_14060 [Paxillus involutus ATCC 200175]|uniref:Uncharacterized protein n=1 Tax=Paxillus involutus ATCC 200175 TaxID=664439 RepID=A0A0C9U146_PAXIN|nr:hypothetical protein PAXINDRAFT_14060 [Paxillus involutus ATCC 200175]
MSTGLPLGRSLPVNAPRELEDDLRGFPGYSSNRGLGQVEFRNDTSADESDGERGVDVRISIRVVHMGRSFDGAAVPGTNTLLERKRIDHTRGFPQFPEKSTMESRMQTWMKNPDLAYRNHQSSKHKEAVADALDLARDIVSTVEVSQASRRENPSNSRSLAGRRTTSPKSSQEVEDAATWNSAMFILCLDES